MAAFGGASIPSGMLIDAVVRPLQAAFTPMRVHKGGSEAKNTCTETSDIDLVVVLHDFDHAEVKRYCDFRALEAFRTAAREVRVEILSYTNHGMKVRAALVGSLVDHTRELDILFTGDPKDNRHDNPPHYYNCFYTAQQVDYVKAMKAKHPRLHDAIITLKTAARERVDTDSAHVPGYFCELLCIKHFEVVGPGVARDVLASQRGVFELECPITKSRVTVREACRAAFANLELQMNLESPV